MSHPKSAIPQRGAVISHANRRLPIEASQYRTPETTDGAVVIPFSRRNTGTDAAGGDQAWSYEQRFRGGRRHFTGEVTYIGGAEGERIRGELAAAIADLLRWARQQARPEQTITTEQDQAA